MSETYVEEVARLQREIAERQIRLQRLILGDPTQGVTLDPAWDKLGPMPSDPELERALSNVKFPA